ncbi:ParA family protein [Halobaculum sp. MBLA0147]|uniref:ParA family protein n=1 Tax=Halobaculum sp. MBLA0147 TaxID=3079934 RepID=UPI0035239822
MLSYTVHAEAGGIGKTTLTANLAVAEARADREVLVVDLDPQRANLSRLLGVDEDRDDTDADHLVRHLIDRPRGPFDDLVRTSEGVDIVPAHSVLERIGDLLSRRRQEAEDLGESWNQNVQLLRVLREADVHERYDTLIVDPPATADVKLYNAVHATRNLVVPFEPSGKGTESIHGLEDLVTGMEDSLDISVGVLAVVPMGFRDTTSQQEALSALGEMDLPHPVTIRQRGALFESCWDAQCSAFEYVEHHRDRVRDYEQDTLQKLEQLATFLRRYTDEEVHDAAR